MIRGQNFLCLGNNMWESNFTNTVVELMQILSQENRVLYVDYEFTLKDVWDSFKGKRAVPVKRMFGINPRLREVTTRFNSKVYTLTPPPVFPLNKITHPGLFRQLLKLNGKIVEGEIRQAMTDLNFHHPIIISGFNPYYGNVLANKLEEKLHVYYCYDEIDAGWHKQHGPAIEKEYMQKTDLVITSSEHLFHKKKDFANNCCLIKNGVDFAAFNKYSYSIENKKRKHSIVGYTGSIDSRFDLDTVIYLITHLPETEFLFAGRVTNQHAYEELKKYPNVTLVGSKKPEEVPSIVGDIDLGIVPYIKNHLTQAVYPLKFNEYLATGKPVVSTDFAHLPEFSRYVKFAESKEEFLHFVKLELQTDSETKKSLRIQFAEKNSWINRAKEFSNAIEEQIHFKEQKKAFVNE